MAPLYGRLTGERSRKTLTRRGFTAVESRLDRRIASRCSSSRC